MSIQPLSVCSHWLPLLCCRRAAGADAVSWYLSTVGNTTVLTRNEEAQLGAIIHLGSAVKRAQKQLQADDGAEPSLDEVCISFGCAYLTSRWLMTALMSSSCHVALLVA